MYLTRGLYLFLLAAMSLSCSDGQKHIAFLAGREVNTNVKRPPFWAQPIHRPGVPNLYRVTDDLYRGDEPTRLGMEQLQEMGVKTVVCVRSLHSTEDRLRGLNLKYEMIRMKALEPQDSQVIQFLELMKDPRNRPVLIHCYTGSDRAGLLAAIYRVVFCGWTKEQARQEMVYGGYGFHNMLVKYLVTYFDQLDIERVKRQAGISPGDITDADRRGAWPTKISVAGDPAPVSPVTDNPADSPVADSPSTQPSALSR